jgi:hypothetical protein
MKLPADLIAKAQHYAAARQTTLTALVIELLEEKTNFTSNDPLVLFSRGSITKEEAIEKLGLHDYAELLVALGDVDLPLFSLPDEEIEKQADLLADILK